MSDENAALATANDAMNASIESRVRVGDVVYGVEDDGKINVGLYDGAEVQPGDAEYGSIIKVCYYVDEDNVYRRPTNNSYNFVYFPINCVFETFAEAKARAREIVGN